MRSVVIRDNVVIMIIVAEQSALSGLSIALDAVVVPCENEEVDIGWTTTDGGVTFSPAQDDPYAIIDILTGEA